MTYLTFDTIARVDEIVTDVLAMDLIHSSPEFLAAILAIAGEPLDARPVAIRRSVADTSLGETDIEMVVQSSGGRSAILIENKVRAPLMDWQFARYRMRGRAGILNGQWHRFKVVLMSPRNYYEALAAEHFSQIDANLSYEVIVDSSRADPSSPSSAMSSKARLRTTGRGM